MRPDGKKKAYIRLRPEDDAVGVASKMGIIWLSISSYLNFIFNQFIPKYSMNIFIHAKYNLMNKIRIHYLFADHGV